jgi:hypothetical protein
MTKADRRLRNGPLPVLGKSNVLHEEFFINIYNVWRFISFYFSVGLKGLLGRQLAKAGMESSDV